jgi:hypothetical protein
MTSQIVPPRVPFTDKNGLISREWYLFLLRIFTQVDGVDADRSILEDVVAQLSVVSTPNLGPINRRIDELSGPDDADPRIAVMMRRLAALESDSALVSCLRAKVTALELRIKSLENVNV